MKRQPAISKGIKQTVCVFLLALLTLAAFAGCSAPETGVTHLKIVGTPYISNGPLYIAQEEGYFAAQGLEVEFVKFNAAEEAVPLLAQEGVDILPTSVTASILNAVAQGANIRIVAGREFTPSDCESGGVMVRKDIYESGELDSIAEIKGKTVAAPSAASLGNYTLAKALEMAGLTFSDVKLVKLASAATVAALANRAVDAAMMSSPFNQEVIRLGYAVTLISVDKIRPGYQQGFIFFGPSLLEKNPVAGEKFMAAYLQGCRQYAQGKTKRNLEIIKKYTEMDEAALAETCWTPVSADGHIVVEDVMAFQDWLNKEKFVEKKAGKELLTDTRFIDYANRALGAQR